MKAKVLFFVTKNEVYVTHYETIVFKANLNYITLKNYDGTIFSKELDEQSLILMKEAKSIAFNYASNYMNFNIHIVNLNTEVKDDVIFDYLHNYFNK